MSKKANRPIFVYELSIKAPWEMWGSLISVSAPSRDAAISSKYLDLRDYLDEVSYLQFRTWVRSAVRLRENPRGAYTYIPEAYDLDIEVGDRIEVGGERGTVAMPRTPRDNYVNYIADGERRVSFVHPAGVKVLKRSTSVPGEYEPEDEAPEQEVGLQAAM